MTQAKTEVKVYYIHKSNLLDDRFKAEDDEKLVKYTDHLAVVEELKKENEKLAKIGLSIGQKAVDMGEKSIEHSDFQLEISLIKNEVISKLNSELSALKEKLAKALSVAEKLNQFTIHSRTGNGCFPDDCVCGLTETRKQLTSLLNEINKE